MWPPDRLVALVRHNLMLMGREPGPIISRLVMPVVLMLVLHPLYTAALAGDRPAGSTQTVTGMLVMFSLLGLSVIGASILSERAWHTVDRLRASPAHPAELLIGKAVPALLLLIAQQAILLSFGAVLFGLSVRHLGLLALAVAGWAVALLGCGAALATLVRSQGELSAATDIGGIVCTCLGGALVPLATMPGWAQTIAPASPGFWAMRALGGALAGDATAVLTSVAVLTGLAILAGTLAGHRLRHGWGRTSTI